MKYFNNIKIKHFFLFFLAYFIAPDVFAAIFDVIPTDKSQQYLGIIFGGSVGTVTLGGATNPMLSKMFARFNIIIVTIGVSILSYIGIVSAINTAREGEALGKKFSLWVPLRAVSGMLLMVPGPGTGYSLVQMTVMWIVLNGIGAANAVWNVVLDQLSTGINVVGNVSVPIPPSTLNNFEAGLLQAATCAATINGLKNLDVLKDKGNIGLFVTIKQPPVCHPSCDPAAITSISQSAVVNIGVDPTKTPKASDDLLYLCGKIDVKATVIKNDPNSLDTFNAASLLQRLQIKLNAIQASYNVLSAPAQTFAANGIASNTPNAVSTSVASGYIGQAGNGYKAQIVQLMGGVNVAIGAPPTVLSAGNAAAVNAAGEAVGGGAAAQGITTAVNALGQAWEVQPQPVTREQTSTLKQFGWIHAGSYYFAMSKTTATSFNPDNFRVPSVTQVPDPSVGSDFTASAKPAAVNWTNTLYNQLAIVGNRLAFSSALAQSQKYGQDDANYDPGSLPALGSGTASTGNGFMDLVVNGLLADIRDPIMNFFVNSLSPSNGEDPLVAMGRFGWNLMWTGELTVFAMIVIATTIMLSISAASCLNPLPWTGETLFSQLWPLIFGMLVLMWTAGATLGLYIPLVPYLIFTTTAIGWMLAVVEAIVGAPIIALGIVQPSGEELGQIKAALGIIANIFLRPTLMIFGFVIAGSLMRAILAMLNFGFLKAVNESVIPTLFSIIPTLMIYVFLIMIIVNKSFSLIYELPNKILRFMGVQAEGGEPSEMVKEAKGGFEAGAGKAQEVQQSMYDAGRGGMAKAAKEAGERGAMPGGGGAAGGGAIRYPGLPTQAPAAGGAGAGGGAGPGTGGAGAGGGTGGAGAGAGGGGRGGPPPGVT